MQIVRSESSTHEVTVGLVEDRRWLGQFAGRYASIAELLRLSSAELRVAVDAARTPAPETPSPGRLLAPIDGQTEVWAAGVTYKRSEEARMEESATPDIYSRVYRAERPEIFFKATPRRVVGPEEPVVVRADSSWDVPEPELAIVVNAHAEIVGYTIGNDVSSRTIEGENPLYLPQAKVYDGSCALGPGIVPAWQVADPYVLGIRMRISRNGARHWQGETSMREFARRLDDLVMYLFREDEFPDGVILCTGTALVPDSPFTLEAGDSVEIDIDGLGTLRNAVVRGKAARRQALVGVSN
ncbi:MAG TPA: fumarylacetoacetate hydrolase family protein [Chloroflexota bacterium]|nr:fumarylacetoacetate hydrolase family protein [Chloroflexota bacterium]